eukprot:699976-Hanusia_phi.AAC.1
MIGCHWARRGCAHNRRGVARPPDRTARRGEPDRVGTFGIGNTADRTIGPDRRYRAADSRLWQQPGWRGTVYGAR